MKKDRGLFVKCTLLVFFISSLSALGCDGGREETTVGDLGSAGVVLTGTLEELPNCSVGKYSAVYYVSEDKHKTF